MSTTQLVEWDELEKDVLKICTDARFDIPELKVTFLNTGDTTLSHISRGHKGDSYKLGLMIMLKREALKEQEFSRSFDSLRIST